MTGVRCLLTFVCGHTTAAQSDALTPCRECGSQRITAVVFEHGEIVSQEHTDSGIRIRFSDGTIADVSHMPGETN